MEQKTGLGFKLVLPKIFKPLRRKLSIDNGALPGNDTPLRQKRLFFAMLNVGALKIFSNSEY